MTSLTFSAYLSNFMQCFISPQQPVSTVHPIYLSYTDLST